MTEADKLKRDMDTLREAIQRNWQDREELTLDEKTLDGIMEHLMWCSAELDGLRKRLEKLSA